MSFNVTGVTGYVQANEKQLLAKSILGAKTLKSIKFVPGVKGSMQLNLLTDGVSLQAGGCGWNPAGTSTISKRTLSTGLFKVNEALCEKDLRGTFAEWELNIAVGRETLPFEQVIAESKVKGIQKAVELLAWNGDTTGSAGTYLDVTDGLVKIIGAASGVVDATPTASTTLLANPMEAVALMVKNIPAEIIDAEKLTIYTGYDVVMAYVAAYNASNKFAGTITLDSTTMAFTVPNTTIVMQGVAGLNGKNKAYLSYADNFIAGGDIQGAESIFEMWYSRDAREFRFASDFNVGFQVAYPEYIVKYTK